MKIIDYFKRLKERILSRKKIREQSKETFYYKCKQGIFSYFRPYLTKEGFYLELEDKEGLREYANKIRSGKTIEDKVSNSFQNEINLPKSFQTKINESVKPIYEAFDKIINYFREIDKTKFGKYSSLSFNYNPKFEGYKDYSQKNKLEIRFV